MIPLINCVGLIKETRTDESRTPLAPIHIKILKKKYPHIDFIVQPSEIRAFDDKEYENCGAKISDNLSNCDIIFGVKEIDPNWVHPILKKNVDFLINQLSQISRIEITRLNKSVIINK